MNELCLNEDEAAQGYNTYSVLKTGKDEYGKVPIRYLSFGENKLPLTGMLSFPFIASLGLNELTVRLPVYIIGTLFPLFFYFAGLSLTKKRSVALIAAFVASGNIWLQTTSRHQHEAVVLAAIVLTYISILFWRNTLSKKHIAMLSALLFFGMYTYHSAKVIMPALALFTVFYFFRYSVNTGVSKVKSTLPISLILAAGILLFLSTELAIPNNRLSNLSYFTNPVFIHEIQEGRRLGGSPVFYNKAVYGSYKLIERSARYISPDFLLLKSDPNPRYGAPYLPLLTIAEYILFVIGFMICIYALYKKRDVFPHSLLIFMTLITILPASLALPTDSSTRSYLLTIPMIILISIATHTSVMFAMSEKRYAIKFSMILILFLLVASHLLNITSRWNTYFHRYLNDARTKSAWQCGMKEVSQLAWKNYDEYKKINVTRRLGQPYIFLLFYGGPYPPEKYQKVARTMPYNEYGFWEQESFDKFTFTDKRPRMEQGKEIFLEPKNFSQMIP